MCIGQIRSQNVSNENFISEAKILKNDWNFYVYSPINVHTVRSTYIQSDQHIYSPINVCTVRSTYTVSDQRTYSPINVYTRKMTDILIPDVKRCSKHRKKNKYLAYLTWNDIHKQIPWTPFLVLEEKKLIISNSFPAKLLLWFCCNYHLLMKSGVHCNVYTQPGFQLADRKS